MQQGWVYVLVNSSMPGLAKVGRTTRSPVDRVAELSQATGVATPFVLAFDQHFADCCAAERAIHCDLEQRGLRIAPNREFFRGPVSDIIRVVIETAESCLPQASSPDGLSAELLLAAGSDCLNGTGERPSDFSEAARLLKLAVLRGSLIAYERLGRLYAGLYGGNSGAARRRTLETLKEGTSKGNYYCYVEMATVFAQERNVASFTKAWESFFLAREAGYAAELETEPGRFEAACCRYIASSVALGLQPGHREMLADVVDGLVGLLLDELDHVRQDERARRLVVAALRWVHQSLPPGRTTNAVAGRGPAQTRRQPTSRWSGLWPSGYAQPIDIGRLAPTSDA